MKILWFLSEAEKQVVLFVMKAILFCFSAIIAFVIAIVMLMGIEVLLNQIGI